MPRNLSSAVGEKARGVYNFNDVGCRAGQHENLWERAVIVGDVLVKMGR